MPLLERARVEAYVPDLPSEQYRNLLEALDREFTYAFGGCTISRGLDGNYLSLVGAKTRDRINLIYADLPVALSTDFDSIARNELHGLPTSEILKNAELRLDGLLQPN